MALGLKSFQAPDTTLYKVTDSIAGQDWSFTVGKIVAVKAGDRLPDTLRHVTEEYAGPTPADVIVFDQAAWERANTPRVDPIEPEPLAEPEVRRRLRLQDPNLWSDAQMLNFPAPTHSRMTRVAETQLIPVRLWDVSVIDQWAARVKRVASLLR